MKYAKILLCIGLTFLFLKSQGQISKDEKKLYDIIMKYRQIKGLSSIPLSNSLTIVAQTHVKDLADNKPDLGDCNAHSWSDNGNWTPCCYTPDHAQAECMWNKPRELTTYKGNGYEIACGWNNSSSNFVMTPEYALKSWQGSSAHNAVIINDGVWKTEWKAIGVGIYKGLAVTWFGHEEDTP